MGGRRLLHVASDEAFDAAFTASVDAEFDVLTVTDATTARVTAASTPVDCILTPYDGVSPRDFVADVRATEPGVPVVFVGRTPLDDVARTLIPVNDVDYVTLDGDLEDAVSAACDAVERATAGSGPLETGDAFRSVLEASPLPIAAFDADGRVTLWNDAAETVFGWTADEVVGERNPVVQPDAWPEFATNHRSALAGDDVSRFEVTRRRKDGTPVELTVWVAPIDDSNGEHAGVMAVYDDVTERRAAERAAAAEHDLLEAVVRRSPVGILVTDADGVVTRVNDRMTEIFETTAEAFVGQPAASPEQPAWTLDGDPIPESEMAVERVRATGEAVSGVEKVITAGGDDHVLSVSAAPVRDDTGDLTNVVLAAEDVTDRRRREQALERERERLDAFAGIVSHDLRNPLTVATGWVDVAIETDDTTPLPKALDALERMDDIVTDVLRLARQGATVDDPEPVSVAAVALAAWTGVDTRDATLDVTLPDDYTVPADESRLCTVFENLYRNAVEHSSTGSHSQARENAVEHGSSRSPPQIREGAAENDTGGAPSQVHENAVEHASHVEVGALDGESGVPRGFFVQDDGPGLPAAVRERFSAGDLPVSGHGSGFGLAIVREIAEAHGWDVAATDAPGGGARFEFQV